jgi:hypothetical protein
MLKDKIKNKIQQKIESSQSGLTCQTLVMRVG